MTCAILYTLNLLFYISTRSLSLFQINQSSSFKQPKVGWIGMKPIATGFLFCPPNESTTPHAQGLSYLSSVAQTWYCIICRMSTCLVFKLMALCWVSYAKFKV